MRRTSPTGTRWSFTLRAHLLALVVGTLLPTLVVAAVLVRRVVDDNRDSVQRRLLEAARVAVTVVDAELSGTVRALQALAESERLTHDDLSGFYGEARRLQQNQPTWHIVLLHEVDRQAVLDTSVPFGQPLTPIADPESLETALETKMPVIGSLRAGANGLLAFPVHVPVIRDGQLLFVLTAVITPDQLSHVVALQQKTLTDELVRAIIDRSGTLVVRSVEQQRFVGQRATDSFIRLSGGLNEGVFRDQTLEGIQVYGAFARGPFSGWLAAVAVPATAMDSAFRQSLSYLGLFALTLVAVGGGGAFMISRRLSRDMAVGAMAAETLARGERPRPPRSNVYEIQQLNDALARSARLLDIRERERDENLVRAESARAEAEAADRAKDEFLAMLGHELRNPLAPVLTALQLMQLRGDTANLRERNIIERQMRHLVRLVEDLLDVSRLRRGRIELKTQPIEIRSAVDEAVETSTPIISARNHQLVVRVPEHGLGVDGDRTRLAQVFVNLLNNAAKYSNRPGTIELSAALDRDAGMVVIKCQDEGMGIAPDVLPRVFDLFAQGRQSLDRAGGGLGLGLAVARTLIELHGGTIEAASPGLGHGSTFTVHLPRVDVPGSHLAGTPEITYPDLQGRRMLVVDDNRDAADLLAQMLRTVGAEVAVEFDPLRALATAAEWAPDTVILDIGLPTIDGFELARRLRAAAGSTPLRLIAVTGYGQQADIAASRAAGFDSHLVKPVLMESLFDALEDIA